MNAHESHRTAPLAAERTTTGPGGREMFRVDVKHGPATRPGGDFDTERAAEAAAIRLVARGAGQCVIYRVTIEGGTAA